MRPIAERRHPLRFVWHMDADGRFGVGSDEFIELVGPRTTAAFGRLWSEIAAELKLDPDNQVARAVATRETWSGIVMSWPVDDSERAAADRTVGLAGVRSRPQLPRLSRFRRLPRHRPHQPIGAHDAANVRSVSCRRRKRRPSKQKPTPHRRCGAGKTRGRRSGRSAPEAAPPWNGPRRASRRRPPMSCRSAHRRRPNPKSPPTLSPVERRAFRELAQELTARLRGPQEAPAAAESDAEGLPGRSTRNRRRWPASRRAGHRASAARPHPDRRSGLPARQASLRQPSFPRMERLRESRCDRGGWRLEHAVCRARRRCARRNRWRHFAVDKSLSIVTRRGDKLPVEGRMFTVPWNGIVGAGADPDQRQKKADADARGTGGRACARRRRDGKPRAQIDPRRGNRRRHHARCRWPHRRRQYPRRSPYSAERRASLPAAPSASSWRPRANARRATISTASGAARAPSIMCSTWRRAPVTTGSFRWR